MAKTQINTKILQLKFSRWQTISAELLNLNWNDRQREWFCPFHCCYKTFIRLQSQKKFRNYENDSLQITRLTLIGVLISHYYLNIRISSADFRRTKIRRRIRLSVAAWGLVFGRSRSLKMVRFDRPCTTFYWSAIVTIALSCTIFELFDVE